MEELNFNDTSLINGSDYSNMSHYSSEFYILSSILICVNWVTIAIGFPLVIIILIAVFFQVKNGQDAPVFVINLLVSDIVQFCSRIPVYFDYFSLIPLLLIFYAALVSVGFMMCVSCERYLVVAKPLWYRFRRTIKTYVVVCMVVWILPVLFSLFFFITLDFKMIGIIITVFLLLPFPVFIFFLVGTIKALSAAFNVPADEKRRIAAIQVVVLIIYTLLFVPFIIQILRLFGVLYHDFWYDLFWYTAGFICVFLSPLANTTLYLFSRKSIMDKFLASICSCKMSDSQETSSTDNEIRIVTITGNV
ncbi:G-protein coupled receptor 4-like [Gambusia affinis]|uniref:G-protein coupled receptor 4-like n=1 Tax=Gambusia affinis TaxID=33528 RepID=UPI001CDC4248|nr:G-protein coupled receptor 4-like [Gambusia affinis]